MRHDGDMSGSEGRPSEHRRRRRRGRGQTESAPVNPVKSAEAVTPLAEVVSTQPPAVRGPRRERSPVRASNRDPERGWRDLAANTPSQVGVDGALRARDVARPSAADLAAAEREVNLIRRGWQPPDDEADPGPTTPPKRSARTP